MTTEILTAEKPVGTLESRVEEAIRLLDGGLSELIHRELVSTCEITDLLLDVRTLIK